MSNAFSGGDVSAPSSPWAPRALSAAFALLLLALVWAPWPLGSNRPWALALLGALIWVGVLLAAAAHAGGALQPSASPFAAGATGVLPLAGLVGFTLLVVVQLLNGVPGIGTLDAFATRGYLLATLLYLGAWLLVLMTASQPQHGRRLLGAVVAAGLLQALGAVLLYSAGGRYEWFFTPFEQGGRATGTFPSPDNLAGYIELCLSAGLGWLLSQLGGRARGEAAAEGDSAEASPGWRGATVTSLAFLMSPKMLLRLLLVVLVIVLVMTHSRMGNGAFFISLAIVGLLVAARSRQLRRPALWLVASMVLVDVFIIGQWVGLERVVQRLQDTAEASSDTIAGFGLGAPPPKREESIAERLQVPRLSLRMVAERPWFGHGGGTYVLAFPPFKVSGLPHQWDHAHNDYVQVACDMGLVGLAMWLLVGIATGFRAMRLMTDWQLRTNRGFGVAAAMALCVMGLHSIVDFNLHIPSNALTFTVLLAAVWAVPVAGAPVRKRRRSAVAAHDVQAAADAPALNLR